jgi:cysteine sulfinate desulfinase/cysteine desulfurase-like protein
MGVPPALAHGALRLTVGIRNTMDEIDAALETVAEVAARLRRLEA